MAVSVKVAAFLCLLGFVCAQEEGENCVASRSLHGACFDDDLACRTVNGFMNCQPPLEEGDACELDGDCDYGLYCSKAGECETAVELGDECKEAYWICGKQGYCDASENVCVPFKEETDACSRWHECTADMTCYGKECVPRSLVGGPCVANTDCVADAYCDSTFKECVGRSGAGDPCKSDINCAGNKECATKKGGRVCTEREIVTTAPPVTTNVTSTTEGPTTVPPSTTPWFGTTTTTTTGAKNNSRQRTIIISGASAGGALLLLLILCICCCVCRRKKDEGFVREGFQGEGRRFSTYA